MKTPKQLNYYMPAEWHAHESTWLSWPKDPYTFPKNIIGKVEQIYTQMITELSQGEIVHVLVDNTRMKQRALKLLKSTKPQFANVEFHLIKSVDVWMRDYGPTFLVNKKNKSKACTKWTYNAYGKWPDLEPDNQTGNKIAHTSKVKIFKPEIVMEGGSLEVNGKGTVLVTEQCQLNKNRNPHLNRKEIERYLKEYLNVQKVIWLKEGIEGDDTDGHVDDIARFVNETTIFCAWENNTKDKNHKILKTNWNILKNARTSNGKKFKLIKVPMPCKRYAKEIARTIPGSDPERRLASSYCNFYIGNSCVLVPLYDKKHDAHVLELFKKYFSNKKIIGIPCTKLVFGYGSIHCVTQQMPTP